MQETAARRAVDGLLDTMRVVGIVRLLRAIWGGRGAILMLHEVQTDPDRELRTGVTPQFLDEALGWLKRSGWDLVGLDEGLERLARGGKRFIVLTFDDAYRDTLEQALPVAERYSAPLTVFAPTGALRGALYSWWLALRELFRRREVVTIEAMERSFECPDLGTKVSALKTVVQWVHGDFRRAVTLEPTFSRAGISMNRLNEAYFLNESELGRLAAHPLVTIGAHTSTHPALATLDEASARREMQENRVYLEELLDRPVRHFAYPYGGLACGPREAAIAAELGFTSAVTTRHAPLTAPDRERPHVLPRIGFGFGCNLARFDAKVSGLQRAALSLAGRD